jgi:hypothetical protein
MNKTLKVYARTADMKAFTTLMEKGFQDDVPIFLKGSEESEKLFLAYPETIACPSIPKVFEKVTIVKEIAGAIMEPFQIGFSPRAFHDLIQGIDDSTDILAIAYATDSTVSFAKHTDEGDEVFAELPAHEYTMDIPVETLPVDYPQYKLKANNEGTMFQYSMGKCGLELYAEISPGSLTEVDAVLKAHSKAYVCQATSPEDSFLSASKGSSRKMRKRSASVEETEATPVEQPPVLPKVEEKVEVPVPPKVEAKVEEKEIKVEKVEKVEAPVQPQEAQAELPHMPPPVQASGNPDEGKGKKTRRPSKEVTEEKIQQSIAFLKEQGYTMQEPEENTEGDAEGDDMPLEEATKMASDIMGQILSLNSLFKAYKRNVHKLITTYASEKAKAAPVSAEEWQRVKKVLADLQKLGITEGE